ncbi:MAG: hypothetical protein ACSHX0_08615 [Akkermansiaceae bacterium]
MFITIATLLCVFVVLWAFVIESRATTEMKVFGSTCALAAIILPIYGVRFQRKVKNINV